MADPIIWLEEIDEDIGHTIVHYLYTGEYQTLRQSGTAHKRQTEYKRSVLVYCAAANLEIPHLQRIAAGHMERFANSVDIYQTLNLVKTLFSSVPWWDGGLYFHIIKRLRNAFRADPTIFERREFLGCLGGDLELDKLMVQIMVSLWEPSKSKPWNHVQSVPENSLREGFPAMERCFELCSISRAPTPIGSEPYVKPDPVGLSPVLGVDYFGQPSTGGEILKRRGSFSENPRKRIRNKFSGNLWRLEDGAWRGWLHIAMVVSRGSPFRIRKPGEFV